MRNPTYRHPLQASCFAHVVGVCVSVPQCPLASLLKQVVKSRDFLVPTMPDRASLFHDLETRDCPTHGSAMGTIQWKCRFCCSYAVSTVLHGSLYRQ